MFLIGITLLSVQCSSSSDHPVAASSGMQTTGTVARLIRDCANVTENVTLDTDLSTGGDSCLIVKRSNVTIDGGGHRITAGQFAIQWVNQSGVTVKNVVSDQGLQIFGGGAGGNTVSDSTFGSVAVYRGDDNAIRNSRMRKLTIAGQANDPAQRELITGNVIEGTLTRSEEKLVEVNTGTDGSLDGDGTFACARGEHVITDNRITGTVVAGDPATEPELLHIKCGTGSTIRGNTIRSAQRAVGILLRDGADDNLVENNDVRIGDGNQGALFIQSGSAGFHHPRNNTIRGNVFRADRGRSFWLQAGATRGNTFSLNLFRSDDASSEAIRLTDGTGVDTLFDHNTFYRGGSGMLVVFRNLGLGSNRFASNIFAYAGGPDGVFNFDHLQSLAGYQGDHNVFFNQNGAVTFGSNSETLCQWKSQTGQDPSSVEGDPRFANQAADDFDIGSDSAARCTGENGSDAGAFSFTGGAPCPGIAAPSCS